jgi:hypothetical protein
MSWDYVDLNATKYYNKKHTTQHMLHGVIEEKDTCELTSLMVLDNLLEIFPI